MNRALVFGGSGQIGVALLPRLLAAGWQVDAVSRSQRDVAPGLTWLAGEFQALPKFASHYEAVVSCGPLDLFSDWLAGSSGSARRVVAFGSTSLQTKQEADDAAERALAQRLREAEARVFEAADARGATAVMLRPTLVYGNGRDASLSRIAAIAARRGFFPLPRGASGLRQPVHVDDLADAAMSALERGRHGDAYALPGGETLPYREMVARVLATLPSSPRLLEMPVPLFRLAVATARLTGRLQGLPAGAVARMREDLVFDDAPARRELGYSPRPFRPVAGMFAGD